MPSASCDWRERRYGSLKLKGLECEVLNYVEWLDRPFARVRMYCPPSKQAHAGCCMLTRCAVQILDGCNGNGVSVSFVPYTPLDEFIGCILCI